MVEHHRIAEKLRRASPWFLEVELRPSPGGWSASMRIDPNMAKARAEQQGLPDGSLAAAARNKRVRGVWDEHIAQANSSLPAGERIVSYSLSNT